MNKQDRDDAANTIDTLARVRSQIRARTETSGVLESAVHPENVMAYTVRKLVRFVHQPDNSFKVVDVDPNIPLPDDAWELTVAVPQECWPRRVHGEVRRVDDAAA